MSYKLWVMSKNCEWWVINWINLRIFSRDHTQELCMFLVSILILGTNVYQLNTKQFYFLFVLKIYSHFILFIIRLMLPLNFPKFVFLLYILFKFWFCSFVLIQYVQFSVYWMILNDFHFFVLIQSLIFSLVLKFRFLFLLNELFSYLLIFD